MRSRKLPPLDADAYELAGRLASNIAELDAYAQANLRSANANVRCADDLYGLIFPPWRWRRWYREARAVRAEILELRRRRAITDHALRVYMANVAGPPR
jgi:hypothetical protein